ncbi:MAG: sigma-54-dependent Fis family transcriptional regulator [Geobacter sp.]|nr:MAG: sigma-54-dependent Fis family transcriptional regulator [Geobacter sp.]
MKDRAKILLVEDEDLSRDSLIRLLKMTGFNVRGAATGKLALSFLSHEQFDIIITDLFLPDINGIDILKQVKELSPFTEVILITGHASAETAVKAMKEGAFDYVTKPLSFDELSITISKALEKRQLLSENVYLKQQLHNKYDFVNIIGSSPVMQKLFERMKRVANTDSTALVLGESGTGKELVARALHFNSQRKDKPFIPVNCAAIPENLLESELFGYVKGAFTGAIRDKIGKFEAANLGSIFLDEIGTMPMHLQTKLLRVLQEQEVERIGSTKTIQLDVRVISATNLNLEEEVKKGNFREDLYYRLNVIPIQLPALRERKEDILSLLKHFIEKNCSDMKRPSMSISNEALEILEEYRWPGNVRELENVVERVVALTDGNRITANDIPSNIREEVLTKVTERGIDMVQTINEIERKMICDALLLAKGVKAKAAVMLNLNRTTLVEKMRRLGIENPQ